MKNIIFILIMLFPIALFGQSTIIQGNNKTEVINKGGFQADSVLFIPHRGDNSWYGKYGDLRINPTTGNLEFRKSGAWIEVGSDSASIKVPITQEFLGQPTGSTHQYVLDYPPLQNTAVIFVNGQALPQSWYSIGANVFTIANTYYPIDSTDIVKILYTPE